MKALLISLLIELLVENDCRRTLKDETKKAKLKCEAAADFDAQKEIWDLVVFPYMRDRKWHDDRNSEFGDVETTSIVHNLTDHFASSKWKEERLEDINQDRFHDLCQRAIAHKLSSTLANCEEAKDMSSAETLDEEKLEKMEVHVFLRKSVGKEITGKCLEPEKGYVNDAAKALESLSREVKSLSHADESPGPQNQLLTEVRKMKIPQAEALTAAQYTSLAKIIHLLEAEASHARELLDNELKERPGAEELFQQIRSVTQLNGDQRQALVKLVKPEEAAILLNQIETEESLNLRHDSVMDQLLSQVEREKDARSAEEQRKRDLGEVTQAIDWLTDENRYTIPEAKVLISELNGATKMSNDQRMRLETLRAQAKHSLASKMHTIHWVPVSLLWWLAQ